MKLCIFEVPEACRVPIWIQNRSQTLRITIPYNVKTHVGVSDAISSSKNSKFRIFHKIWVFMSLFLVKLGHLGTPEAHMLSIWIQNVSQTFRYTIPYIFKKTYGCLRCHLVHQNSKFR